MSDNTNDVFDDILEKIAGEIYGDLLVATVGKNLGFNPAATGRFNDENARQGGSHMGTLNMLRKWRQGQTKSEERENLKAALKKSKQSKLVDAYFPSDNVGKEKQASHAPPAPTEHGASPKYPEGEKGHEKVEPDGGGYYKQKMKQAKPSEQQLDLEKNYKMDAVTKGHMFVLNMSEDRKGSHVDVTNIQNVFEQIGFEIQTHSDLTAEDLQKELKKFVEEDEEDEKDPPRHKGMCSAVFLLMGHGNEEGIECADKKVVTTKFIRDTVSGMKYMNGKPKMIFYQCCRGGVPGEMVEHDQAEVDKVTTSKSDVFIVHATTHGNVAVRHKVLGSWFIQMLCEEFLENAHDMDLSTMLEQVTKKIEKEGPKKCGQTPVVLNKGSQRSYTFFLNTPQQSMTSPAEWCWIW